MKTLKSLTLILVVLGLTAFAPSKKADRWKELLERGKLVFEQPAGTEIIAPIENRQMNYEFAVKYPGQNFEIRYAIRPMDSLLLQYENNEKNKKPGDIFLHPNKYHPSLFQATALNISAGRYTDYTEFPKEAVKEEFNADWGATTFVPLGEEFGQKYQFCTMVAIHKENVADAYIFFMGNEKVDFEKLVLPAFYSLKFKK